MFIFSFSFHWNFITGELEKSLAECIVDSELETECEVVRRLKLILDNEIQEISTLKRNVSRTLQEYASLKRNYEVSYISFILFLFFYFFFLILQSKFISFQIIYYLVNYL